MWFVEPLNVVFHVVVRFAVGYITIMHTVTSVTIAMNIKNLSDKQLYYRLVRFRPVLLYV